MTRKATGPSPEEWLALYDAARRLRAAEPWQQMSDADVFGVRDPETGTTGYCCVMGQLGEYHAMHVYLGGQGHGASRVEAWMIPWEPLACAPIAGGDELRLLRRGDEYTIRVGTRELMNSRLHGSEEALAERACDRIASLPAPRVLVGGLGMGYTLAATLRRLPAGGRVDVIELVPAVIDWNRDLLGHLAGHPLQDPRVSVQARDVASVIGAADAAFDAILLDVDNGPAALARQENDGLYARAGLDAARKALRPEGVLAVWSAGPDRTGRFRCACGRPASMSMRPVCVRGVSAKGPGTRSGSRAGRRPRSPARRLRPARRRRHRPWPMPEGRTEIVLEPVAFLGSGPPYSRRRPVS